MEGESITIAANRFPGVVPVSTDAMRFRVLLNDSEDITALASYDAATSMVSLPQDYMGHFITVEWYCPASEAVALPVKATICAFKNGRFTTAASDIRLPSNANSISIPLAAADALVESQNDIELPADATVFPMGCCMYPSSPLGGDVTDCVLHKSARLARSAAKWPIRAAMTRYITATTPTILLRNGNTAFCLNGTVASIPSGTLTLFSRYLQPCGTTR
jgi:hypothetical protein